jgi:4-hydroxybenzoate polyprenyltransferase
MTPPQPNPKKEVSLRHRLGQIVLLLAIGASVILSLAWAIFLGSIVVRLVTGLFP